MNQLGKILLVEDDSRDVELTLMALEKYKLSNKIVVTRDGVEALDYLYKRGKFENTSNDLPVVILLDLKMPRMNGIEVIRTLKSDERMRIIPIVVLTSSQEDLDLKECYRLGVNAYVVKPVRFSEFVEAVENIGVFWALLNELPKVDS
ncbi:response regulator [Pelagicoccus sp. SDUM812003]|uniref:response regulator n=1 Tax=Pelagicoccus sp. SDUM812003 TaxID=3041267 RepID=UPI00280FD214|nr:response regulator [Pelagicoccus sp. SDUM812003]MDQ8202181.1 response regulator [Pelagicoccus sp. SDUM812003]